ncbi:MAG TPA: hypothetical protein VMV04_23945 [Thermodesulfobacteriota bacterium]|nr:hypothetical protein [Thermodesulfobacteriota bacterium]
MEFRVWDFLHLFPKGRSSPPEKRLKFVQNNEEFAQKLSTPAWQNNGILSSGSKKFQYFSIIREVGTSVGMDIATYFP